VRFLKYELLTAILPIELEPVGSGRQRGYKFRGALTIERLISGQAGAFMENTSVYGGPNGIRTRVSALRGPCPGPLDDGAGAVGDSKWLGEEDSNLHYGVQSPASYH
jgi:hypothetical protein